NAVAPRWLTFTCVPTVTYPSSRSLETAPQDAFSINAIIIGVPKTSTPPAPTDAAVFSCTTSVLASPFIPTFSAISQISFLIFLFNVPNMFSYYTTKVRLHHRDNHTSQRDMIRAINNSNL